jgi:hypothetical protein
MTIGTSESGLELQPRKRVVLTEMSRLLHDIVKSALDTEKDLEVFTTHDAVDELESGESLGEADVVILSEDSPAADDHAKVLYANPRIRVIGISDRGRGACLYELQPHRQDLGELSAKSLVRAIRAGSFAGGEHH